MRWHCLINFLVKGERQLALGCPMAGKKRTDLPITGERGPPRYEVRIGERVEDSGGDFDSLDEAKACLARKRRLDRDCHIWDRRDQKRITMGTTRQTRRATALQMDSETTSSIMQKLIGGNKVTLNDLAKRGIVVRGERRGTYKLAPSVSGYCEYLRTMVARRGGESGAEARARLGTSS
jgi:hypothetical protein